MSFKKRKINKSNLKTSKNLARSVDADKGAANDATDVALNGDGDSDSDFLTKELDELKNQRAAASKSSPGGHTTRFFSGGGGAVQRHRLETQEAFNASGQSDSLVNVADSVTATNRLVEDEKTTQVGPLKGSSFVRTTTFTDHEFNICKDYQKTGTCGYGDNCIYVHTREVFKHGWELERDWEAEQAAAKKKRTATDGATDAATDADSTCSLCKEGFKNPVITVCEHQFCELCILAHYKSNKACPQCSTALRGIFNQPPSKNN